MIRPEPDFLIPPHTLIGLRDTSTGPQLLNHLSTPSVKSRWRALYNENTVAVNGATTYNKDMGIATSPQTADKFNVQAEKTVTFSALDAGRMTSGEETAAGQCRYFHIFNQPL